MLICIGEHGSPTIQPAELKCPNPMRFFPYNGVAILLVFISVCVLLTNEHDDQ